MRDEFQAAVSELERALLTKPNDFSVLHDLSVLYARSGNLEKAIDAARQVSTLAPEFAEGWLNLGNLYAAQKTTNAAADAFTKATRLAPEDPLAWFNLGNVLAPSARRGDAITALERAHRIAPGHIGIMASLALAYRKHCRLDDAIAMYGKALAIDPTNVFIKSNLIITHQYVPAMTDEKLQLIHGIWQEEKAPTPFKKSLQTREATSPLRVGYVSGDFRQHPIGYFLLGVLRNHDASKVHAVCFSDTNQKDSMTDKLMREAGDWIETTGLNHDAFLETVRTHDIDVLVDLSGHFARNRLPAFSKRAAPVQVTWAGYVGTTGIQAMDWLIADQYHAPEGYEAWVSENVARLPYDYICYTPPDNAPTVRPLPYLQSDIFTFGCFNNLVKVNRDVIALWAKVLAAVPNSRLLLKCQDLEQPDLRASITQLFVHHGIDEGRINLREKSPHVDLLQTYNEVDIALDPFPYSGGLTTLEALWMGVPVITKTGNTFAGRHSTAHLHAVGLSDWVCSDEDGYLDLASTKASDIEDLSALRNALREKMRASPVCDARSFTRSLERTFHDMWSKA